MANARKKILGTALVTGGSKRIGEAICLSLSALGFKVAIHYRDSQKSARRLAHSILKNGGQAETFPADLSREEDCLSLIRTVQQRFPDLNVLINNASIFKESRLESADLPLLDEQWQVNFKAPYILTCEFSRLCREGNIINILDTHIVQKHTSHFAYLLSKKLLAEFTQMAALALAPDIRVNGIAPGLILSPWNKPERYLQALAKKIPLQRKGHVAHITHSVRFLLENDYLTGQIIFNDGGEHLL